MKFITIKINKFCKFNYLSNQSNNKRDLESRSLLIYYLCLINQPIENNIDNGINNHPNVTSIVNKNPIVRIKRNLNINIPNVKSIENVKNNPIIRIICLINDIFWNAIIYLLFSFILYNLPLLKNYL